MSVFQIIPFVAYIAVASPATYKLTSKVLGSWVANSDGLATLSGVALHAVVYVLLVSLLMTLLTPRASGYGHMTSGYGHMTSGYMHSKTPKSESESAMDRLMGRS